MLLGTVHGVGGKRKRYFPTLPVIVHNLLYLSKAVCCNLLEIMLTVEITQKFPLQTVKYDHCCLIVVIDELTELLSFLL